MAVTTDTIATALGVAVPSPTSPQAAQWQMWISDALMLIDARKAEMGVTGALDPARLDYVVREAVTAQVRRPDDATQVSVSVDDGNVSRTFRSGTGRVSIRDEWWALLGLGGSVGQAFAIDTVARGGQHIPWCALAFGALYCSCGSDLNRFEGPLFEGGSLSSDPAWL